MKTMNTTSFLKDGHSKGEEHYSFYGLTPWANRLPDCSVFGIDWEGPQGWAAWNL